MNTETLAVLFVSQIITVVLVLLGFYWLGDSGLVTSFIKRNSSTVRILAYFSIIVLLTLILFYSYRAASYAEFLIQYLVQLTQKLSKVKTLPM